MSKKEFQLRDAHGNPITREEIKSCVGPGWGKIFDDLIDDLEKLGWDGKISQYKEKFGRARLYIGSATEDVYERINKFESLSATICEKCGNASKIIKDIGWLRSMCQKCLASCDHCGSSITIHVDETGRKERFCEICIAKKQNLVTAGIDDQW